MALTRKDVATIIEGMAPVIREFVGQEIAKAVAGLDSKIKSIADRPIPEHVGKWVAGTVYRPMQMVQLDGSCWCALRETKNKPGDGDTWRLIAKAGKDAR